MTFTFVHNLRWPWLRRALGPAAVVLVGLALLATTAAAQDRREKLTSWLDETRIRAEKAEDKERRDLQDIMESYRHELGSRNSRGEPLAWQVGYHKTLIGRLTAELNDIRPGAGGEGGKEGGGAATAASAATASSAAAAGSFAPGLAGEAQRAWRQVARHLLERAGQEPDEGERNRYAFAGMLLVHNDTDLDALLAQLPKVDEARKAVPEGDASAERRDLLSGGLAGAGSLVDLGRRIKAGKTVIGHSELGGLRNDLARISRAVLTATGQEAKASGLTDEEYLKQIDDLETRAKKLATSQAEIAAAVIDYLGQVRFGLGYPKARPRAISLLDNLRIAMDETESLLASVVAPEAYRKQLLDRLRESVKRLADPGSRQQAYNELRDLQNEDRGRLQWDALPVAAATKTEIFQGRLRAQETGNTSKDDNERNRAWGLHGAISDLTWRVNQAYTANKPAIREMGVSYGKGLKALEEQLATVAATIKARQPEAEAKCWETQRLTSFLSAIRNADGGLAELVRYTPVPEGAKTAAITAAAMLFDQDPNNDQKGLDALNELDDLCELLTSFYDAALEKSSRAEAAKLTRNRYFPLFKLQAGRVPLLIRTSLDKNHVERDLLQTTIPLYRMMAEWLIVRPANESGDLAACRAGRQMTFDPQRVTELARTGADRLDEAFGQLQKPVANLNDLRLLALPVKYRQLVSGTAVGAYLEARRDKAGGERIDFLLAGLQKASQGDPGQDVRERWQANWHANQAMEAYRQGYDRTANYHALALGNRNNPLRRVPLVGPDEPRRSVE